MAYEILSGGRARADVFWLVRFRQVNGGLDTQKELSSLVFCYRVSDAVRLAEIWCQASAAEMRGAEVWLHGAVCLLARGSSGEAGDCTVYAGPVAPGVYAFEPDGHGDYRHVLQGPAV